MSIISNKIGTIKPSPTLSVNTKAAELKKKGVDVISLGAGEPDFDTPENIKRAAILAIQNGLTKYTNNEGTPELKQAVIDKFQRENNLTYHSNEVIISNGGKQVIYNLFMATLDPEDEVIIPAPYWVSYPDIVILSGGKPVVIETAISNGFKLNWNHVESSITCKTKWLVLNSPSNPSGMVYDPSELSQLAQILRKYPQVHVMSDDIYEHILFDGFIFK